MILPCDNHPEQSAMILLTNLEDGSTATFCGECLVQWAGMLVEGLNSDQHEADPEPQPEEESAQPESDQPTPDAAEFPDQAKEPAEAVTTGEQAESVETPPAASH